MILFILLILGTYLVGILIGRYLFPKHSKADKKIIARQKDFILELLTENDRILGLLKYDKKSKKNKS